MKTYLRRVAQQSGVRFPVKRTDLRSTSANASTDQIIEPLHRHETTIASPFENSLHSEVKTSPTASSRQSITSQDQTSKPFPEEGIAHSPEKLVASTTSRRSPKQTSGQSNSNLRLERERVNKQRISSEKKNEPAISTIIHDEHTGLPGDSSWSQNDDKRNTQPDISVSTHTEALETQQKRRYFPKTIEVIEGRDVEPDEAQSILLHEIQQWTAAANDYEKADEITSKKTGDPVASLFKSQKTKEHTEFINSDLTDIHLEQNIQQSTPSKETSQDGGNNFDLSIGTISVVIEGEEHPPQPVTTASNRNNGHNNSRGRSRLSRNYI